MLTINSINKSFGSQPILRNISLNIGLGEVVVLLGPSGCGKTTLLRIIAGLEEADNGRLLFNDQDLTQVPIHLREFGMVFQDYALFPHKDVSENIAFGLRMKRWEQALIVERVGQVLDLVGLAGFEARKIYDLSGGEQQRVALARSLAPAPKLLLLDEPLGALDRALRERLMLDLRAILKRAGDKVGRPEGITAVYVTHDQAEAFAIADRVAVMNDGRIEQIAQSKELYRYPATPFVARFLGMENLLDGQVVSLEPLAISTTIGNLSVGRQLEQKVDLMSAVSVLIRPDSGKLVDSVGSEPGRENIMSGIIQSHSYRGRYQVVRVAVLESSVVLKFEMDAAVSLPLVGSEIRIAINPTKINLLPPLATN